MFLEDRTRYLYIPSSSSAADQAVMVRDFVAVGYDARHVLVCATVWEVLGRLDEGVVLVVYSVGLVGFVVGSGVCSLREEWFSAPVDDTVVYQQRLYELGSLLPANQTQQGLDRVARWGRKARRRPRSNSKVHTDPKIVLRCW